jgi:hypothetical protein
MDPLLTQMDAERDDRVEKENERTMRIFDKFLREEIRPYLENLETIDAQIRASAKESFNSFQANASIKLSLNKILDPSIQDYKLYWQPEHITHPQAREAVIHTGKKVLSTLYVLKEFLLSSVVPSLEEFRQVLRSRYTGAIISSMFVYQDQEESYILISIVYTLKQQFGIKLVSHPISSIHGGVLWSGPTVKSSQL